MALRDPRYNPTTAPNFASSNALRNQSANQLRQGLVDANASISGYQQARESLADAAIRQRLNSFTDPEAYKQALDQGTVISGDNNYYASDAVQQNVQDKLGGLTTQKTQDNALEKARLLEQQRKTSNDFTSQLSGITDLSDLQKQRQNFIQNAPNGQSVLAKNFIDARRDELLGIQSTARAKQVSDLTARLALNPDNGTEYGQADIRRSIQELYQRGINPEVLQKVQENLVKSGQLSAQPFSGGSSISGVAQGQNKGLSGNGAPVSNAGLISPSVDVAGRKTRQLAPAVQTIGEYSDGTIPNTATGKNITIDNQVYSPAQVKGYNTIFGNGTYGKFPGKITDASIGQLTDWARQPGGLKEKTAAKGIGNGYGSTAMGMFQINTPTMESAGKALYGDAYRTKKFTPEVQREIAKYIYDKSNSSNEAIYGRWPTLKQYPNKDFTKIPFSEAINLIPAKEVGFNGNVFPKKVNDITVDGKNTGEQPALNVNTLNEEYRSILDQGDSNQRNLGATSEQAKFFAQEGNGEVSINDAVEQVYNEVLKNDDTGFFDISLTNDNKKDVKRKITSLIAQAKTQLNYALTPAQAALVLSTSINDDSGAFGFSIGTTVETDEAFNKVKQLSASRGRGDSGVLEKRQRITKALEQTQANLNRAGILYEKLRDDRVRLNTPGGERRFRKAEADYRDAAIASQKAIKFAKESNLFGLPKANETKSIREAIKLTETPSTRDDFVRAKIKQYEDASKTRSLTRREKQNLKNSKDALALKEKANIDRRNYLVDKLNSRNS